MELDPEAVLVFKRQAKVLMRKRSRALRASVPKSALALRSEKIAERLLGSDALKTATRVALFDPILQKNEIDLGAVDAALRARGALIFYPSIDPVTREMVFREVRDLGALEERGLGFREPPYDAPEALVLDVIVVPALAIDGRGFRLGYGAGFYDRTLPRYAPPAVSIGVVFDFQLAADLPDTEGDVPVDQIATDMKWVDVVRG